MTRYSIKYPEDATSIVIEQRLAAHGGMTIEICDDIRRRINLETTEKNMESFKANSPDLEIVEITAYQLPTINPERKP